LGAGDDDRHGGTSRVGARSGDRWRRRHPATRPRWAGRVGPARRGSAARRLVTIIDGRFPPPQAPAGPRAGARGHPPPVLPGPPALRLRPPAAAPTIPGTRTAPSPPEPTPHRRVAEMDPVEQVPAWVLRPLPANATADAKLNARIDELCAKLPDGLWQLQH